MKATYLGEPRLQFCTGQHTDPKVGVTTHGPFALRGQPPRVAQIGIVGTAESIESATGWFKSCIGGVPGEGDQPGFPGCTSELGFMVDLVFDPAWHAVISRNERDAVLEPRRKKDQFVAAVQLIDDKLAQLAELDSPPDYVVLALPQDLVDACGSVKYRNEAHLLTQRDLRRALKAAAMRHRLPTQILLGRTIEGSPRQVDHKSRCAWNMFTCLYFKLGGIPWAPIGLDPDTCFVGISFFRPVDSSNKVRAALARAFNGRGDAIVLRGEEFPWQPTTRERSPHLDGAMAEKLVQLVLQRYTKETGRPSPTRVVIHKTSRFWPEELAGFKRGLRAVPRYDLLAVGDASLRLLREGKYPILRGTHVELGEIDFLYTTGYIPALRTYPHGHVPLPIQIADHHGGDTTTVSLLKELLILSKMNWNSADYASRLPATLGSARAVGEIMRELGSTHEPLANLKYYV